MKLIKWLQQAQQKGASDLHLCAGNVPMVRIDGEICPLLEPSANDIFLQHNQLQELIYAIMTEEQIQLFEKEKEIDFSINISDDTNTHNTLRFRVNIFLQSQGIAAVFRTIPSIIPTLKDLNCPPCFKDIVQVHSGLVIVTGATGSGKSTTLAALVNYINGNSNKHILTIEDPIEFTHKSKKCLINQRQIHRDTQSFGNALRSGLREDPDIILIGEMRDLETIRLALTAAETGHLVLATLHTSSAAKTINRIIDVFPSQEQKLIRTMLAESLQAVIAQRLIKKNNGGRVASWEILMSNPAIKNLIKEDKIAQMTSVMQTGKAQGMQTMEQHIKQLVQQGIIAPSNLIGL